MSTKQIDTEAVARALLMGDVGRFEEHVLGVFLDLGDPVEHKSEVATEEGFSFLVFSYNDADLLLSANRILQKPDLQPRAYNAARIAKMLPTLKETLRTGNPSWQFAQMMCRIAGGVPTGGGQAHAKAIANQRNAKKLRTRNETEAIKKVIKDFPKITDKEIGRKLEKAGSKLTMNQVRGKAGRIRKKNAR